MASLNRTMKDNMGEASGQKSWQGGETTAASAASVTSAATVASADTAVSASVAASAAFADSKPHYELLDALRGVAALLVLWYHVYEGFAFAGGGVIKCINHGYLAVDFFFMLSGFVISYAYDDRWRKQAGDSAHCEASRPARSGDSAHRKASEPDQPGDGKTAGSSGHKQLTLKEFFRRRIVRLHPMVVLGAVLGAITFLIQGSVQWDGSHVATSAVMIALLFAMFMIPAVPGQEREVRGNGEMFPLNGPAWSLFFEYIGNIIYALIIRRLSDKALAVVTVLLGITLAWFTAFDISGENCLGVGWTLDNMNFWGGLLRMLFPFTLGMLISRKFRKRDRGEAAAGSKKEGVKGAFWICSAILAALMFVPYIETRIALGAAAAMAQGLSATVAEGAAATVDSIVSLGGLTLSLNGLFEAFCIIIVFPAVVWLGAAGNAADRFTARISKFLGDISFPLYIIHYPFMYLFYAWLIRTEQYTLAETWPVAIGVCIWNIFFAWLCLKFYDEPARKWLNRVTRSV